MKKIRFAIIGSGWRSLFYVRIAKALPEYFTLTALCCLSQEKAQRFAQEFHIPAVTSEEEVISSCPDFIVSAVSKTNMWDTVVHWMDLGFPVLSETPAGLSFSQLAKLWEMRQNKEKPVQLQVAEQYQFYPRYQAMINLAKSGRLGEPVSLYLSAMHDYHAASIIRCLLNTGLEEVRLTGNTFQMPVTETKSRYETFTDGKIALKDQRLVTFEFEKGKLAFYDFMSDQYRSPIRSRNLHLRGTRGEAVNDTVYFLNQDNLPQKEKLQFKADPLTGEILEISIQDETLYTAPFGSCGLPEDETAIAQMLAGMKTYLDTGKEIYPLEYALEDAYLALLMSSPSVLPGKDLSPQKVLAAETAFLANGWFQRSSSPRPWK